MLERETVVLAAAERLVINRLRVVVEKGRGTLEVRVENGRIVDVVISHREDHSVLAKIQAAPS
ncbi:MAG TPA: hypothetical protein VLV86_12780 [Vicinamibacterales bacterium]|nr:hypothetical protein [Vicinamibacterales bacterium]